MCGENCARLCLFVNFVRVRLGGGEKLCVRAGGGEGLVCEGRRW